MRNIINPDALYWASFNRFEMRLSGQCVIDCSQPGPADAAVAYWTPRVFDQIARDAFPLAPGGDKIRRELDEYGAWSDDELADSEQNMRRIVWIAANNISDEATPDCSEPLPTTTP